MHETNVDLGMNGSQEVFTYADDVSLIIISDDITARVRIAEALLHTYKIIIWTGKKTKNMKPTFMET